MGHCWPGSPSPLPSAHRRKSRTSPPVSSPPAWNRHRGVLSSNIPKTTPNPVAEPPPRGRAHARPVAHPPPCGRASGRASLRPGVLLASRWGRRPGHRQLGGRGELAGCGSVVVGAASVRGHTPCSGEHTSPAGLRTTPRGVQPTNLAQAGSATRAVERPATAAAKSTDTRGFFGNPPEKTEAVMRVGEHSEKGVRVDGRSGVTETIGRTDKNLGGGNGNGGRGGGRMSLGVGDVCPRRGCGLWLRGVAKFSLK